MRGTDLRESGARLAVAWTTDRIHERLTELACEGIVASGLPDDGDG